MSVFRTCRFSGHPGPRRAGVRERRRRGVAGAEYPPTHPGVHAPSFPALPHGRATSYVLFHASLEEMRFHLHASLEEVRFHSL